MNLLVDDSKKHLGMIAQSKVKLLNYSHTYLDLKESGDIALLYFGYRDGSSILIKSPCCIKLVRSGG